MDWLESLLIYLLGLAAISGLAALLWQIGKNRHEDSNPQAPESPPNPAPQSAAPPPPPEPETLDDTVWVERGDGEDKEFDTLFSDQIGETTEFDNLLSDHPSETREPFGIPTEEYPNTEAPPEEALEPVRFTVFHPQEMAPGTWYDLLTYVHLLTKWRQVEEDSRKRLDPELAYGHRDAGASRLIRRGADVTIVPELPGCRFNPPAQQLSWIEDWHRAEFRVQADPASPDFQAGRAVNGRIAFYIESILVGEVPIWTLLSDKKEIGPASNPLYPAQADPYQSIFISYSHEDGEVVDRLDKGLRSLGMGLLRDITTLRSGEKWNPALIELIDRADIFQLYWSPTAKASPYVEQEWRHALSRGKENFIRPVYWQKPLPAPPPELTDIHFSFVEL